MIVAGPCLDYCHEHRSKLRRIKSQLEFQVRLQDFIELVRSEKRVEAIKWVNRPSSDWMNFSPGILPPPPPHRYARKYFGIAGNEQFLREIQMAMGLLAFSPATKSKRYQVSPRTVATDTSLLWSLYLYRNCSPCLVGVNWSFYSVKRISASFNWVPTLFLPVSCRLACQHSRHRIPHSTSVGVVTVYLHATTLNMYGGSLSSHCVHV